MQQLSDDNDRNTGEAAAADRAGNAGTTGGASGRTTRSPSEQEECAAAVLDVGLLVSRFVRAGMWQHRPAGLTLNQFRALNFLSAYPDASPSELAEYLLLSRPAVTRLVDDLVAKHLLARRPGESDRRRIGLSLTTAGRKHLDDYFAGARRIVAERLAPLTAEERAAVTYAMALVGAHFERPRRLQPARTEGERSGS